MTAAPGGLDPLEWLTGQQCAAELVPPISWDTWRAYVNRGLPKSNPIPRRPREVHVLAARAGIARMPMPGVRRSPSNDMGRGGRLEWQRWVLLAWQSQRTGRGRWSITRR